MMNKLFLLLFTTLLLASDAAAQDNPVWFLSGELRQRSELDQRTLIERRHLDDYHLLRARIGVTVEPSPGIGAFVQLQNARLFGEGNPAKGRGTTDASADQIDLHQAYIFLNDAFGTPLDVKLGRQEMRIANERILGVSNWSNTGRSFDGVMVSAEIQQVTARAYAARLVDEPAATLGQQGRQAYSQNLWGVDLAFRFLETNRAQLFLLADNITAPAQIPSDDDRWTLSRFSPGIYLAGERGFLDYSAEAILQAGKSYDTRIAANLFSGTLGVTLPGAAAPRIAGTYTRLSGPDGPGRSLGSFNTVFGTGHRFYGYMDYFPAYSAAAGLQDLVLSLGLTPAEDLRLSVDLHHFMATEPLRTRNMQGDLLKEYDTYGQEVDFVGKYRYNPNLSIEAGASTFFIGEMFDMLAPGALQGEPTAARSYWLYLMTTFSF